jgi:hypothetical protein
MKENKIRDPQGAIIAYSISVWKPEENRPHRKLRFKWLR